MIKPHNSARKDGATKTTFTQKGSSLPEARHISEMAKKKTNATVRKDESAIIAAASASPASISNTAAAAISTQITTLVGESEFVTAGSIDTNSDTVAISCSEVSTRLWDLIDEFIAMGDTSGNRWVGGVMAGRKFDYRQAETTVTHSWHNGRLYDKANVPVLPSMIKPDIIVHNSDAPKGETPPGGNLWSNPQNFYIEEVEFIYPDQYRLTPYRGV